MNVTDARVRDLADAYVAYLRMEKPSREVRMSEEYRYLSESVFEAMNLVSETPANPDAWKFFLYVSQLAASDWLVLASAGEGFLQSWLLCNLDEVAELVATEARRNPAMRAMTATVYLDRSHGTQTSLDKLRPFVAGIVY